MPQIRCAEIEPLVCSLCKGFKYKATVINECMHSFCKPCIVKFLGQHGECPECGKQLQGDAFHCLRYDKGLDKVIESLVPEFKLSERQKEEEFNREHGISPVVDSQLESSEPPTPSPEPAVNGRQDGEMIDENSAMVMERAEVEAAHTLVSMGPRIFTSAAANNVASEALPLGNQRAMALCPPDNIVSVAPKSRSSSVANTGGVQAAKPKRRRTNVAKKRHLVSKATEKPAKAGACRNRSNSTRAEDIRPNGLPAYFSVPRSAEVALQESVALGYVPKENSSLSPAEQARLQLDALSNSRFVRKTVRRSRKGLSGSPAKTANEAKGLNCPTAKHDQQRPSGVSDGSGSPSSKVHSPKLSVRSKLSNSSSAKPQGVKSPKQRKASDNMTVNFESTPGCRQNMGPVGSPATSCGPPMLPDPASSFVKFQSAQVPSGHSTVPASSWTKIQGPQALSGNHTVTPSVFMKFQSSQRPSGDTMVPATLLTTFESPQVLSDNIPPPASLFTKFQSQLAHPDQSEGTITSSAAPQGSFQPYHQVAASAFHPAIKASPNTSSSCQLISNEQISNSTQQAGQHSTPAPLPISQGEKKKKRKRKSSSKGDPSENDQVKPPAKKRVRKPKKVAPPVSDTSGVRALSFSAPQNDSQVQEQPSVQAVLTGPQTTPRPLVASGIHVPRTVKPTTKALVHSALSDNDESTCAFQLPNNDSQIGGGPSNNSSGMPAFQVQEQASPVFQQASPVFEQTSSVVGQASSVAGQALSISGQAPSISGQASSVSGQTPSVILQASPALGRQSRKKTMRRQPIRAADLVDRHQVDAGIDLIGLKLKNKDTGQGNGDIESHVLQKPYVCLPVNATVLSLCMFIQDKFMLGRTSTVDLFFGNERLDKAGRLGVLSETVFKPQKIELTTLSYKIH